MFGKPVLLLIALGVIVATFVLLKAEQEVVLDGTLVVVDFQTCLDADGLIMESNPRRCKHEGVTYREDFKQEVPSKSGVEKSPESEEVKVIKSRLEAQSKCVVAGCSGQLCISREEFEQGGGMSTCEFREEYMCYKQTTCEVQESGECGWTESEELTTCFEQFTGEQ